MTMLRGLVTILCGVVATLAAERPHSAGVPSDSAGTELAVPHGEPPVTPLPFFYDLYTFRGDQGSTTVVAAVAVQVGRLRRERKDSRVRYRFDVRFVVADTARRTVFNTIDSVFVSRPRALPRRHLLHTAVELHAPPSEATLQRLVVTDAARPGVGQLYHSPFPIPDYSGTDLMLSDIALGLPGATAGWSHRGVTLALLPTSQFPESSFDVYYEIYNLPSGNPYETEIAIAPLDDDGQDPVVRARFAGESTAATDGTIGELRRVQSALPKGHYRLTVTVEDMVSREIAQSSRLVQVRGWGRGTTLVPAMPRGNQGH
jgi:hypothetical protein